MRLDSDTYLYGAECSLLIGLLAFVALRALVRRLSAPRLGLAIGAALFIAFSARIVVAVATSSIGALDDVRGPDDPGFLDQAAALGQHGLFAREWASAIVHGELNVVVPAVPIRLLGSPGDMSLRVLQIAIAVGAIAIVAAAVYDLAGPRAAMITAWVLALEPSHVFFSTLVHKEALMFVAEAIVMLGAVRMWRLRDRLAGVYLLGGIALAASVRLHVAVFLCAAALVVTIHAALHRMGPSGERSRALLVAAVVFALVSAGIGARELQGRLDGLQRTQNAALRDREANLTLDPVDVTTVGGVARAVPIRVRDYLLRPYPWQTANVNQRLGVIGTLTAWTFLALVLVLSLQLGPRHLRRLLPIGYLTVAVLIAYSLGLANAGTGFRHRSHLLMFLAVLASILFATLRDSRHNTRETGAAT